MLNLEKLPDHLWERVSLLMMCLSLFHDEMEEEVLNAFLKRLLYEKIMDIKN